MVNGILSIGTGGPDNVLAKMLHFIAAIITQAASRAEIHRYSLTDMISHFTIFADLNDGPGSFMADNLGTRISLSFRFAFHEAKTVLKDLGIGTTNTTVFDLDFDPVRTADWFRNILNFKLPYSFNDSGFHILSFL
jgi:hypothetical protein